MKQPLIFKDIAQPTYWFILRDLDNVPWRTTVPLSHLNAFFG
jgi:hypothetical protein